MNDPQITFKYFEKEAYLLVTMTDKVLTVKRARIILEAISEQCKKYGCSKVLVNELALERRDFADHEIPGLGRKLPKIHIAFLCQPQLVDKQAKLLSLFTFSVEYIARHFSDEGEATDWLLATTSG